MFYAQIIYFITAHILCQRNDFRVILLMIMIMQLEFRDRLTNTGIS